MTDEDRNALDALNVKQIEELFTNYGDIDVAFLDGGGKAAPKKRIHELQPNWHRHSGRDGNSRTEATRWSAARAVGILLHAGDSVAIQAYQ